MPPIPKRSPFQKKEKNLVWFPSVRKSERKRGQIKEESESRSVRRLEGIEYIDIYNNKH